MGRNYCKVCKKPIKEGNKVCSYNCAKILIRWAKSYQKYGSAVRKYPDEDYRKKERF